MSEKPQELPQPTKGFVLLKILSINEADSITKFRIEDKETPQRGEVLLVGNNTWYETIDRVFEAPCKVGDIVVHSAFGFEDIRFKGQHYRLCPFGKILAIIPK